MQLLVHVALFCQFGIGEKKFYMAIDWYMRSVRPTPLVSAMGVLWGLSMSDLFIYLLTKLMSIRIYVL